MTTDRKLTVWRDDRRGAPLIYTGASDDWYIVYSLNECMSGYLISRSNMDQMIETFEAIDKRHAHPQVCEDGTIDPAFVDACYSHEFYGGAFGRGEWLFVNPACEEACTEARRMLNALDEYPVLDDERLSELEYEAFLDTATQALSDLSGYGYGNAEAPNVAPFVLSHAEESRYRDPSGSSAEDWYPDKRDLFWGLVAYRRAQRMEAAS